MGVYNPSLGTTSQKPYALSKGYPVDDRSYYYDEVLFKWRPYQSTAEVLFYLNTPAARGGQFPIIVNIGGTLSGAVFTGGVYKAYWFKDGILDSNLVLFHSPITVNHVAPDSAGNIQIDTGGSSGTPYVLPIADNATVGGVKVTGINGVLIDPVTGEISTTVPSFLPRSVPYAAGNGRLTEDNGGLFYNGTNLTAGHNDSTAFSGVGLNSNRAGVYGSNDGMLLRLGDTSVGDADLDKSFQFYNLGKEYLTLYTTGDSSDLSTYKNFAKFNSDVIPVLDITYSLGTADLRWLGIFADTITATNIITDSLTSTNITTTNLFAGDIVTNNLTANNIQTDTFIANTANITNLTVTNLTAENIDATTINTTTLNAVDIFTTNITADNAYITDIFATNITTVNLTATTITTNILNATTINTDVLNSITINTTNLYATNANITNLTVNNLTANIITTNILNATDINVTNLISENITTNNLYATDIFTTNITTTNLITENITIDGNDLTQIINNISYAPYGDRNQVQFVSADNTKDYYTDDLVVTGTFVTSTAELDAAKGVFIGFDTIFSSWKRFSHGIYTGSNRVLSNTIPGVPLETNAWNYNSSTDKINCTVNSNSFIGFVSPDKYSRYEHSLTLTGIDNTDDDWICTVIAYAEDTTDMVANSALGLNPADFAWDIDTTSATIPNQHTLSLFRGRSAQTPYNIGQTLQYSIVYNFGKPSEQVVASGESLVWQAATNYGVSPGKTCDIKIVKEGDIIKTYTTQWSDAPGGQGALSHELSVDMSTIPYLAKLRGKSSYGYAAFSQLGASYSNVSFSPNVNTIYDVRNGNVWVANSSGVYSLDSTRSYYTDYGVRRILYNPTTASLIYVKPDKTFEIMGGAAGGRFGIEDNTSGVDRSVDMGEKHLFINNTDDFEVNSNSDVSGNYSGIVVLPNLAELYNNTSSIDLYSNTIDLTASTIRAKNSSTVGYKYLPLSVNGNFADVDGNITISAGGSGDMAVTNYIVDETPSGTINGSNAIFTLAFATVADKEMIFLNGTKQKRGTDYSMTSSTQITFTIAPDNTDGGAYIDATYYKQ